MSEGQEQQGGQIIPIGKLRQQRDNREQRERLDQATQPTQPPSTEPTKGRGGYKAAIERYRAALTSGDEAARTAAANEIYKYRGNKGADVIAAEQIRHLAEERMNAKAKLHVVKPGDEDESDEPQKSEE